MSVEGSQVTRIDMEPEEIIRIVVWRSRICGYMFVVAAIWIVVAAAVYFVCLGFDHQNFRLRMISFVLQTVGYGIFSLAFCVQLAIYRCPCCDKFLNRLGPDKLSCP